MALHLLNITKLSLIYVHTAFSKCAEHLYQ